MIHKFTLLTAILLIGGCQSSATIKGEDKTQEHIKAYNDTVVAPLMYLINTTCTYNAINSQWPNVSSEPGQNSYFKELKSTETSSGYNATYLLKNSNLKWQVNLLLKDNNKTDYMCSGTLLAMPEGKNEGVELNVNMDIPKDTNKPPESFHSYQSETLPLTKALYFPLMLTEKSNIAATNTQTKETTLSLSQVVIAASICAILDIEPTTCTGTQSNIDKMEQMQKEKQRLKNKANELKNAK